MDTTEQKNYSMYVRVVVYILLVAAGIGSTILVVYYKSSKNTTKRETAHTAQPVVADDTVKVSTSTPVATAGTVNLSGVKIEGVIPEKIFQAAHDYLVTKLGAEYVRENVILSTKQTAPQSSTSSYKIVFIDTRYAALLGIPGKEDFAWYDVEITRNGNIDENSVTNKYVPNCVKDPSHCVIKITKKDFVNIVSKQKYAEMISATSTEIWVHNYAADLGCVRSTKDDITFKDGWFWESLGVWGSDMSFRVNINTGAVNICKKALGDH